MIYIIATSLIVLVLVVVALALCAGSKRGEEMADAQAAAYIRQATDKIESDHKAKQQRLDREFMTGGTARARKESK